MTALAKAAMAGHYSIAQFLLKHGADKDSLAKVTSIGILAVWGVCIRSEGTH